MIEIKKLKPWVYKDILDIIDLDTNSASEKNVNIKSLEISNELYGKIDKYLGENRLKTFMRYSTGGRHDGSNYYTYSIYFNLTHNRKKNKFYINNRGAQGYSKSTGIGDFRNPYRLDDESLLKLTPTMLQLFYGLIKKYPEHILSVQWNYYEEPEYLKKNITEGNMW